MRSLKPWLRITDLRQELDRLFDRVFESRPDEFQATGDWVPSLDLSETMDALVLKMEVPGMDAKDVQVSLQESLLTVKGERKKEKEETGEQYHRRRPRELKRRPGGGRRARSQGLPPGEVDCELRDSRRVRLPRHLEAPDETVAARVVMIIRSYGHGQTETWTAMPWERFEIVLPT